MVICAGASARICVKNMVCLHYSKEQPVRSSIIAHSNDIVQFFIHHTIASIPINENKGSYFNMKMVSTRETILSSTIGLVRRLIYATMRRAGVYASFDR